MIESRCGHCKTIVVAMEPRAYCNERCEAEGAQTRAIVNSWLAGDMRPLYEWFVVRDRTHRVLRWRRNRRERAWRRSLKYVFTRRRGEEGGGA